MSANLHHLQLFYYVAKAKGISAAVKIIPFSVQQPAVSQQIKQLEKDMGVVLFERRPFLLTPAGERLYKFVSSFFDNLERELTSVKDESAERVSFGCPMIISVNYFPELIATLKGEFNKILPCVKEVEGDEIFAELLANNVDVAVTLARVPSNKKLSSKKVVSLPLSIIVPDSHSFVSNGYWAKTDFKKQQWICLQGTTGGSTELIEGMALLESTPEFVVSTNSVEAALNYVENGFGICLMAKPPENVIASRKVVAVDASEHFGSVDLSVVWSNECAISKKLLDYFIRSCENLAKKYVT